MAGFTESIAIEMKLEGADGIEGKIKNMAGMLQSIGSKKTTIKLDDGRIVTVEQRLKELKTRIDALKIAKELDIISDDELAELSKCKAEVKAIESALRLAQKEGKSFGQTFKSISASVSHFGGAMQSMGNALTRFSAPVRGLMRGTVFAAGYKALNMVTSGFEGMFERYDIMQNYDRSMKALGLDAEKTFKVFADQKEAMTAIDNLNEAVLGLPTGLDEIIAAQRVYAGATGEMVKSTKTAIAANNTFLASSMGAREQRFMQRYLVSLASGAELTTMQWQSMARIAPLAMRAVSEELGYASNEYQQFTKDVQNGTIAGDEFLKAFIKVGTDGRVAAAANVMKTTWEGLAANIQNATRRMGENALKALDDVFKAYNGRNLIQNLLGVDAEGYKVGTSVKDILDGVSASIQNWIRSNPEKILDFIESVRNVDWKGFARGFVDGFGELFRMFKMFTDYASGRSLEGLGRWMVRFSWLGRSLVVMGGIVKGLRHPIALVSTVLSRLFKGTGVGSFFGGIFGWFRGFFGKKSDVEEVLKVSTMAKTALKSLLDVAVMAGTVTLGVGTGVVAFKGFKTMLSDLKEITQIIKEIDWGTAGTALIGMGGFLAGFYKISATLTPLTAGGLAAVKPFAIATGIVGAFTTFVSGVAALDMWLLRKGADNLKKLTDSLIDAKNNLQQLQGISIDKNAITSTLDALAEVYELFKPKYQGNGIGNMSVFQSKSISKVMNYMVQTIDSLTLLEGSLKKASSFTGFDEATVGKIKDIFTGLGDIYDEINKSFSGTNGTSVSGSKAVSGIVENTKKTFDTLLGEKGIIAQISNMEAPINKLFERTTYRRKNTMESAGEALDEFFGGIGDMYRQIAKDYGWMITEGSTASFQKIMANTKETLGLILGEDGILAQIGNLSTSLPQMTQKTGRDHKSIIDVAMGGLDTLFSGLGELYKRISDDYGWEVTGSGTSNVTKIVQNMKDTMALMLGEDGLIGLLTSMETPIHDLVTKTWGGNAPFERVKDDLETLFEGMGDIMESFNATSLNDDGGEGAGTFFTAMESFKKGIGKVQEAITQLQEIGSVDFEGDGGISATVSQIKGVVEKLKTAFSPEAVMSLLAQVNLFKIALENVKMALQGLGGEEGGINVDIVINHTITGDTETVDALETAHDDIKAARDAIEELSGSISLSFPISGSVTGEDALIVKLNSAASKIRTARANLRSAGGGASIYASTGGYIGSRGVQYRASGGSIFKRRGSDVVPAMLSHGEYVESKRAVDFFGIDFMRKVNHLDVQGTLRSLMTKAGSMASASTTINNYNNQKVIINNNNSSGAGYTFKRASRFVGAI